MTWVNSFKLQQHMLKSPCSTTIKKTEFMALKIPTKEYQSPDGFAKKFMKCYKELPPVLYDLFIIKNGKGYFIFPCEFIIPLIPNQRQYKERKL